MEEFNTAIQKAFPPVSQFMDKTFTKLHTNWSVNPTTIVDNGSSIIVSSHRSHVDYVLLAQEMVRVGIPNIRIAAGDNLTNIPRLGKKLRSLGAFSVYRGRSLQRNYITELCLKTVEMLENGGNILVFPEGGRSYKGNMLEMKKVMTTANVIGQFRHADKKFLYLPVAVSYEILPELQYFDLLEKGRTMRGKKGFFNQKLGKLFYFGADIIAGLKFLYAHKFRRNYGEVFIDFGTPFYVDDVTDVQKNHNPSMRNEFSAHKKSIADVGDKIHQSIYQLYRVLPMHVVAFLLKSSSERDMNKLISRVTDIIAILKKHNRNCNSLDSLSDSDIISKGVELLKRNKAITLKRGHVSVTSQKKIDYFAATIED